MKPQPFRILSLDGGGIMGAFAASALATFERATGRRIVEHFDLITGTSTGGIIAIGLAMGASAEQITGSTRRRGRRSSRGGGGREVARAGAGPLPAEVLKGGPARGHRGGRRRPAAEGGQDATGDPGLRREPGRVYLFKTPHHPAYTNHADLPAVDVALATSAAPTYFPAHTIPGRGTFIDGGLWANCPAMVGIVEALDFWDRPPSTSGC